MFSKCDPSLNLEKFMPITHLHQNIIDVAGNRGAMFISGSAINSAVLDSLRKAAFGLTGVSVDTLHPLVTARFDSISIDPSQLITKLIASSDNIFVEILPDFDLTVSLVYTKNPSFRYSEIVFNISEINFRIRVDGSDIRFQLNDPRIIASFKDNPAGSRDAAIEASGIDKDELLRLEGSFAYGTGTRLVTSLVGKLPPIELGELFPAISFSKTLELAVVNDSLVIIPESMSILELVGCPNGNAANGIAITPQTPSNPTENSKDWSFNTNIPPSNLKNPNPNEPFTALHIPKSILDIRFGRVSPAISYRERGNGFIGYDV